MMRSFFLMCVGVLCFAAAMGFSTPDARAVFWRDFGDGERAEHFGRARRSVAWKPLARRALLAAQLSSVAVQSERWNFA